MRLIGLKEVQELLGCSRNEAIFILSQKDAPTLNRTKNQHYKVFDEDLMNYLKRKVWK